MHIYDFIGQTKSNEPIFLSNFQYDMADIKKFLKTASESDRELASMYKHYMEARNEAFAEAGARLMLPPSNEADCANFEFVFPRVTQYVQVTLRRAGIITDNELGRRRHLSSRRRSSAPSRTLPATPRLALSSREETRRQLDQLAAPNRL